MEEFTVTIEGKTLHAPQVLALSARLQPKGLTVLRSRSFGNNATLTIEIEDGRNDLRRRAKSLVEEALG